MKFKQQEQDTKGLQTPSLQQLLLVLASFFSEDLQQLFSQVSFLVAETAANNGCTVNKQNQISNMRVSVFNGIAKIQKLEFIS